MWNCSTTSKRGGLDAEPVPIVHGLRVTGAKNDRDVVAGVSNVERPSAGRTSEPGSAHDAGIRRKESFGRPPRRSFPEVFVVVGGCEVAERSHGAGSRQWSRLSSVAR